MSPFLPDLALTWGRTMSAEAPVRVGVATVVALAVLPLLRRPISARVRRVCVGLLAVLGLALAWREASVVDDAFTAFRYARQLLDGNGLVYNPGERVEGYTDLAWVLLVAAGTALTGVELPEVALFLDLLCFAGNVVACDTLARRLRPGSAFPVAAVLLVLHTTFLSHATTGLETQLATLLIQLGAIAIVDGRPARAGAWFVLAMLTRPDAGLFWIAGAIAIGPRRIPAYLAPSVLFAAVAAWRWGYYGDIVPNTYWAKGGYASHLSQGAVYLADFWLGSHGWVLLLLALGWLATPGDRRLRVFLALAVPAQLVYVARLGGDFMSGRFFVCLVPLLLAVAEDVLHDARRPAIVAGLLAYTAFATPLIGQPRIRWWIADEGAVYPLVATDPVRIDHPSWGMSRFVRETLTDRGIRPVIASGTIGMLGYYSMLELIDLHGLTDRRVARLPLGTRGHPGHEKFAENRYLRERRVQLVTSETLCPGDARGRVTRLKLSHAYPKPWCIFLYDRALMAEIRARAPEWGFTDFEVWLDQYLRRLDGKDPAAVAEDLRWFRHYYFDHNDDPARLGALERWLAERE